MTPIEFPEQTIVWAKNQPPYLPLPAFTNNQVTISCWRLTWRERLTVLWRGQLWLQQMNFGGSGLVSNSRLYFLGQEGEPYA